MSPLVFHSPHRSISLGLITSLNTGIQDGLHVPCCKYTMLPCLPLRPHGFITQMFRLFLNECIKDLKNGTCLFQVPVLWFIRNEREKNGSVKQKREGEACERWGRAAVWIKGIHGNVCTQEATHNGNDFLSGETVIYTIWETQSDTAISLVKQRTVVVWARSGLSSFGARSRYGDVLGWWQQVQMQMDAASVKPALTLWQLSGMQSGNTIWDIAFPHNPTKTVLQSHIMNISFFFTNPLPRCGIFLFFFLCFPSPWFKWFSLS